MDLIYTNAKAADLGVLSAYAFDLSFGAKENDFEMVLGNRDAALEFGAYIYMEGTEYGGIVDGMKTSSNGETVTYKGRTWHGILNSKIIAPDAGEDYFTVSGDANAILSVLIARLGLSGLFAAAEGDSGISISGYQFHRYCKAYDGIRDMLADNGAKLLFRWVDRAVVLSAVPVADYTESPIDGDIANLTVEQHKQKVNHLICLGKGDLAAREVVHLYVDRWGNSGTTQHYTGLEEVTETYDYSNVESSAELQKAGIKRLKELMNTDKADISILEMEGLTYDIGDIVGASDIQSGVTVAAVVTQKIVKIQNGAIRIQYKTGG